MVNSFFAAEIFVGENSVLYKEDTDKGALTKWIKNKGKHDFFIKEFKTTIVVMCFGMDKSGKIEHFCIENHFVREKNETRYRERYYDNGAINLTKKYWLNVWE